MSAIPGTADLYVDPESIAGAGNEAQSLASALRTPDATKIPKGHSAAAATPALATSIALQSCTTAWEQHLGAIVAELTNEATLLHQSAALYTGIDTRAAGRLVPPRLAA